MQYFFFPNSDRVRLIPTKPKVMEIEEHWFAGEGVIICSALN